LRIFTAHWVALPALKARRFHLATASVSTLGYDQNVDEPVIRLLNDAPHHTWRTPTLQGAKQTNES
jgi:hypothetical protein